MQTNIASTEDTSSNIHGIHLEPCLPFQDLEVSSKLVQNMACVEPYIDLLEAMVVSFTHLNTCLPCVRVSTATDESAYTLVQIFIYQSGDVNYVPIQGTLRGSCSHSVLRSADGQMRAQTRSQISPSTPKQVRCDVNRYGLFSVYG